MLENKNTLQLCRTAPCVLQCIAPIPTKPARTHGGHVRPSAQVRSPGEGESQQESNNGLRGHNGIKNVPVLVLSVAAPPVRASRILSLSLSLHGGDISDGSDVGRNGRSGRYRRVCQGQGCQPERGTLETLGRDTVTSSLAGDFACSLLVAGTKEFPLLCGAHPGQPSAIPSEGPVLRKGTDKHQTPAETNRPSRPLCTHA